jgi:endo-alpha-1,4-polygalactosaminidase (GH114 family)
MKPLFFSTMLLPLALAAAVPSNSHKAADRNLWQPAPGTPYQMILRKDVDLPDDDALLTPDVPIWIVDLFNTYNKDPDLIHRIRQHGNGKKVICYFSAGTSESFRPDFKQFDDEDMGGKVAIGDKTGYWEGENWLDIRSPNVFKIMQERIQLAKDAGCDAIDPDNLGRFNFC